MKANSQKIWSETIPFTRVYTGAGITAVGTVIAPFAPPVGGGLIGVGSSMSLFSGTSSMLFNFAEGEYTSGSIDALFVISGQSSTRYLKNLHSSKLIQKTDFTILEGLKNTSFDIMNIFVSPTVNPDKE